jgi:hypothetical protein
LLANQSGCLSTDWLLSGKVESRHARAHGYSTGLVKRSLYRGWGWPVPGGALMPRHARCGAATVLLRSMRRRIGRGRLRQV